LTGWIRTAGKGHFTVIVGGPQVGGFSDSETGGGLTALGCVPEMV